MQLVDAAILDVTEWACHKFQRLTGLTNVWLAVQVTNLSIIVYFAWAAAYFWRSDLAARIAIALFCGGLLYLLTQTLFKVPIETAEASSYLRAAQGFRNPRRLRDVLLRISFLTLSLMLSAPVAFVFVTDENDARRHIVVLTYFLIVLTTVVLYLLACDPLPPCVGKIREWLRQGVGSRSQVAETPSVPR